MVKANIDRILDLLKERKTASVPDIARILGLKKEDVQKSADYLEEDGIVKVEYKLTTPYLTLIKSLDAKKDITPEQKPQQAQRSLPPAPSIFQEQKPDSAFMPKGEVDPNNMFGSRQQQPPARPMQASAQTVPAQQAINHESASPASSDPGKNKYSFLLDETQNNQFQSSFGQESQGQAMQAAPVMEQPPQDISQQAPLPDINPLDENPHFQLATPTPDGGYEKIETGRIPEIKTPLNYGGQENVAPMGLPSEFPKYAETEAEKIEFMIQDTNKKLLQHDYKDLNVAYRNIYDKFTRAELSTNERVILGDKINLLFDRIKRTYLIEKAI